MKALPIPSGFSWPSLLEVCLPEGPFKSVFFCASAGPQTCAQHWVLSLGFSPLVSCICTSAWPASTRGPLDLSDSHPQLLWGCGLWSNALIPLLLNWGLISPCPGPTEVVTQLVHLPQCYHFPSDIPTQNWTMQRHWCIRCHHYISQWIVVSLYQERLIGQVLLEMFCNHPLQCQELKLCWVIISLMGHEGSAAIGNKVISSVYLLLLQHCP